MHSIRARLNLYLFLIVAPILIASGIVLSILITDSMLREYDWALESEAKSLASLADFDEGEVELEYDEIVMPEFARAEDPHYFEIWSSPDELLFRSKTFGSARPKYEYENEAYPPQVRRFQNGRLADGRMGRRITLLFTPRVDEDPEDKPPEGGDAVIRTMEELVPPHLTLIVARERETLDKRFQNIYLTFGLVGLAVLAAFAIVIHFLLRNALRPLDRMSKQVRSLDVPANMVPIEIPNLPTEIVPVVAQINALLDRVATAFERERQLTSNIGHELKTPVAELRSLCEVGTRWPTDAAAVQQFFADALAISEQMDRIISNLLMLARFEAGKGSLNREFVEIKNLLVQSWKTAAQIANQRDVTMVFNCPPGAGLVSDPEILSLILSNLLTNAAAYANAGTTITCTAMQDDSSFTLCIANATDTLETNDLEKIFDRFWRKDTARSGGHHLGLGLAMVKAFSALLDLRIETSLDETGIFTVGLTGPLK